MQTKIERPRTWRDVFSTLDTFANADTHVSSVVEHTQRERVMSDAFMQALERGPLSAEDIRIMDEGFLS